MNKMTKLLTLALLPLFACGAWAEVTQDCILEGTVDKSKAEETGRDVYVAFHSADRASNKANCKINRRNRLEFKEPKNSMIENAPDGSTVKYRYTERDNQKGHWQLLDVSMQ